MHLAQFNIARAYAPIDSPIMKEFADQIEHINAIAEASPGFIWRLKDDSGNATYIQAFDDPSLLINMSVWENVETFKNFVFKSGHLELLKQKAKWFEKPTEANHVMWWIEPSLFPNLKIAENKLTQLRTQGDSPEAFGFRHIFEPAVSR